MVRRGSFIGGQDNLSVPDAPTIGTATAGNAQVSVAFTAPSDVGDDPITNFGVSVFPATGTTRTFRVTVASGNLYGGGTGNVFYIDGVSNPALTLVKGFTYVFDQEDSSNSGHPLHFKDTGGSQYSTGVTVTNTAGQSGAKVTLVLAEDATEPSQYYCTSHGNGMGNLITLVAPSASDDPLGQAQYSNTGSSSPIVVTGLTNDTSYVAKAWAINDYGNGPLSDATSSFTPVLPTPGVDFDGANDYLSRTSDLSGNADGKTFTFSTFVYLAEDAASTFLSVATSGGSDRLIFSIDDSQKLAFQAYNSSGTRILNLESRAANAGGMPINTWTHILLSVDLANSSNRHLYINDVVPTHVDFDTYTDGTIDFTNPKWGVGGTSAGGSLSKMRFGGLYLDYTYRDLSTTSNRRLFVDADGLYVAPPTSGILSLAMTNATSVATNSGTGGDFTLNGTVAQSGRNAFQYNAAACEFDGVGAGDKLVRTSQLSGITDTKTGTFRFSVNSVPDSGTIMCVSTDSSTGTFALVRQGSDGTYYLSATGTSGSTVLDANLTGYGVKDKWETHCITFDLSDTSKRAWFVNGVATSPTWSTYVDGNIDYTRPESAIANQYGTGSGASPFQGQLSDIWFDNSYTSDLSVFYDTTLNKPKNLGADGSTPTGSSPIIYLPLRGNNAGINKGTGGDFTVNSGPFTGVRGPSEFWGESADFNGSSQYISRTSSLSGISDSRFTTVAFSLYNDNTSGYATYLLGYDSSSNRSPIIVDRNGAKLRFYLQSSSGQILAIPDVGVTLNTSSWFNVLISDNRTTQTTRIYVNGTAYTPTPSTNTVADVTYGNASFGIAGNEYNGDYTNDGFFDGRIGYFYFTTEFIDFSSEANRLKFFDAFGYPVDLGSNGSTPTGTQPLIYINKGFHNGTNLGSGGNFTPQGTPTDGGYVKG